MERSIKAQDLQSQLNNVTLIDVRRKVDLEADSSKLLGGAITQR